ncbi:MAG TPA: glutamate racemase [Persephonella sp.]|uniref:Glutamate racemase n=1 Tax=Persephonella marina (strain DSM 14350 / EX-H1) TaxID=123214 RepID=MURI_PERMH|nr:MULTISPECIES: glutamate racemase [Persephonella]C0QQ35.1 RecName: Full=Glutamate racemase [Persephonella marina EX-H1]ACO04736.1 glutamate racemase [Persephonella marina EX-H1]HCB69604.1 glutamate racemase [Persephonella sp.]
MSIGIFDSGVGGLTVFREIDREFPFADIYYLGDTARVPYGNKSKETIIRYSLECANYLYSFGIDALIVACNTASSYAIEALRESFDIPVIGVIKPGVELAVKTTKNGRIGVIGTQATIKSGSYRTEIEKKGDFTVYQKPCPLFVPLVEEGLIDHKITELTVKEYLDDIVSKGIDTLILGCTHYPLLKDVIKKIYPHLNIIDSSKATALYLKKKNLDLNGTGERKIFITDESPSFEKLKDLVVGSDIHLEKLELSKICTL